MDSIELQMLERRARQRYELARLGRALAGAAPVALFALIALALHGAELRALALASTLVAFTVFMLFYGRDLQRAVLPGAIAGLAPFTLAYAASVMSGCGTAGCSTSCMIACTIGGFAAGLSVAAVGRALKARPTFWIASAGVAGLVGMMGCACVGISELVGLGAGIALGFLPSGMRRLFAAS